MPFTWSDRLDVGVEEMNNEHKMLINKMNRVETLAEKGASKRELSVAIDDLGKYTIQHFADEEAWMEKVGFPQLRAHKHVHQNMLTKFTSFAEAFAAGDGKLPDGFVHFLNFWLRAHISGVDKRYGDFVNNR